MTFEYECHPLPSITKSAVCKALPTAIADKILLTGACHVDHEGFDLNEIEQAYYHHNHVSLIPDATWYKDGGQTNGTNAVIATWFTQKTHSELVLDHSHFVFKYPIVGEARTQLEQYAVQRPELLRILSARFKAGLDLCVDYFGADRVEPIVHIEWDFECLQEMHDAMLYVQSTMQSRKWLSAVPILIEFNRLARLKKLDAFQQADTRSMIIFGEKSYKLIPTL